MKLKTKLTKQNVRGSALHWWVWWNNINDYSWACSTYQNLSTFDWHIHAIDGSVGTASYLQFLSLHHLQCTERHQLHEYLSRFSLHRLSIAHLKGNIPNLTKLTLLLCLIVHLQGVLWAFRYKSLFFLGHPVHRLQKALR